MSAGNITHRAQLDKCCASTKLDDADRGMYCGYGCVRLGGLLIVA